MLISNITGVKLAWGKNRRGKIKIDPKYIPKAQRGSRLKKPTKLLTRKLLTELNIPKERHDTIFEIIKGHPRIWHVKEKETLLKCINLANQISRNLIWARGADAFWKLREGEHEEWENYNKASKVTGAEIEKLLDEYFARQKK